MVDEDVFRRAADALYARLWPIDGSVDRSSELRGELATLQAVFADWLEERGDPRAAGYRWLARFGKYPRRSGDTWDWWRFGGRPDTEPEDLPEAVWDCLPGRASDGSKHCKEYPSPESAERAVCRAVRTLEAAV